MTITTSSCADIKIHRVATIALAGAAVLAMMLVPIAAQDLSARIGDEAPLLAWHLLTANRQNAKVISDKSVLAEANFSDEEALANFDTLTPASAVTGLTNNGVDIVFRDYKDKNGALVQMRQCHTGWLLYVPLPGSDDLNNEQLIKVISEAVTQRIGPVVDLGSLHRDGVVYGARLFRTKTSIPDYVHGEKGALIALQFQSTIGVLLGKSIDATVDGPQSYIHLSLIENDDWFNPTPIPGKGGGPLK